MDRKIFPPWWRKRIWLQAGIAAVVFVTVIVMAMVVRNTAGRSVRVRETTLTFATVTQGVFHDFIPLRGKAVSRDTVYLDALEGGRVERVSVEPGDMVTMGQPLVELSNTELELDVLDREARLIESITQLQTYQTQLEQNRLSNEKALALIDYNIVRLNRSVQRRRTLAGRGVEAQELTDAVVDELEYTQKLRPMQERSNVQQNELRVQQLPRINGQLEKLQKDVEITRGKLDNLLVRAPVAGRMTAIDLKVGENRSRGERLGEITPATGYKLSVEVDEFYLGRLHNGQLANVQVDGKNWALHITRVYPQVKNGTFTVDLAFAGATPDELLPGQAVQGKLALGDDTQGIVVPAGAFLDRSGGDWIFVVAADGESAQRRAIKIARRNAEQVEVVSGLQPGERVITSDYTGFEHIDHINLIR